MNAHSPIPWPVNRGTPGHVANVLPDMTPLLFMLMKAMPAGKI
jgi:hypothetical protein